MPRKMIPIIIALVLVIVAAGYYFSRPPADDTPGINSTSVDEHPETGKANVVAKITDLDGVKEALIEMNGVNSTMTNAPGGLFSKSDTYFSNVTMGDNPVNLPFKIYATDERGHSAVSSGNIDWSKADAAITSAYLNNRNTTIARMVTQYMPGMLDYPISFLPTVDAITNVAYNNEWKSLFLKNGEDYLWEKGLAPAVNYIINLENSGKIDVLDKVLSANSTLDNLLRQMVILPDELSIVNMTSGQRDAGIYKRIEMLSYNTNPNPALNNTSPQEYIGNLLRELYNEKGEAYNYSICAAGVGGCYGNLPGDGWPNSHAQYKVFANELAQSGNDLPLYIKGIPDYMRGLGGELPLASGQGSPYYSVLVGREFGIPTVVYGAVYLGGTGTHNEPGIWINDSDSFSVLWKDLESFIKDYEGYCNPILYRLWNNQTEYLIK